MTHRNGGSGDLSMAGEDYLEAIYRIALEDGSEHGVRSVDVAEQLGVSKASVSKALAGLRDSGYVEQVRYGRVRLTEEGRAYAKEVWHRHRLLRTFLTVELGVDADVADDEACLMEHAISNETMQLWMGYLERHGVAVEG